MQDEMTVVAMVTWQGHAVWTDVGLYTYNTYFIIRFYTRLPPTSTYSCTKREENGQNWNFLKSQGELVEVVII